MLYTIRLESKLAQNAIKFVKEGEPEVRGTLKTKQNLRTFLDNGSRPPPKNASQQSYISQYLSSFMTENKDLVTGDVELLKQPTVVSSEKLGLLAGAST